MSKLEIFEKDLSIKKLERKNKELKKSNGKLSRDNDILIIENTSLQKQIKEITQDYEFRLESIRKKLIELGEEELFRAYLD